MKLKMLAAVAGFGALLAGPAHAAYISGSISFNDGFDLVPDPADLTCVVNCGSDNYNINNVVNVYSPGSATGDFVGTTSATASDLSGAAVPFVIYSTDSGFTFTVMSYSLDTSEALACAGSPGLCLDSIGFNFSGTVSGAGFDDTFFSGRWTAQGSCNEAGNSNQCLTGTQSGSWSASVVALQVPPPMPEPGTLALLGLGLAGLGFSRRRRA